ncbi:unnamed protein product [Trichobilharzia szidati]|nr:unnamed protein product [Trichobilharzia szidati]
MEKLQQLLQQQQQQQQQIQNQLYQNSFRKDEQPPREEDEEEEEEEEMGEEDIEEEDESLQEFLQPQSQQQQQQQQSQEQQSRRSSKPELPAAQEQLLQQKLSELQSSQSKKQQAPAPPVLQQQEPKKPEFSVRHQPIPQPVSQQQQPSQQGQKSQAPPPPPAQQQPAAMLNGDHLKHESDLTKPPSIQVSQFDRKFRNSWRKSPEDFTAKQQQQQQQMVTKKASKLSENDISSQADEEGEEGDITEDDVYRLHDELEHAHLQNNEMKKALNEARTIIDQQQNQLTEFRRLAAQYQTDTEAFKMKSMFLLNNTQTRDEQVTVLMEACERLEAEIDALTWQLDQAKHSLDLKTQECDFLNEQLDEIQLNAGSNSTMNHNHIHTNNNNLMNGHGHHDSADHIIAENMDKANTGTDQLRSTLSTEYRSIIGNNNNNHTGHMNTMSTGLNMNAANDLSLHMELQKLQEEIEVYRKKEEDWEKIHVELLQRQKILEEEKKQQELVIGRLAGEQVAKNKAENPQDNDVENDIPLEIVATLNNLHEEKTTWKLYASSLVRSFVENCEEFIRKTPYNEPYFESDGERRWYTYSMHLLENLLHVAPYMLAKSDLDLLKRTVTKTTTKTAFQQKRNPYLSGGGGHGSSVSEPQLITTSDFPLSASQIQLQNRNMNVGQLTTSEFAQLSASSVSLAPPMLGQSSMQQQSMLGQEQQLFTQMSYPSGMSTQKNMSERAARAASKSIPDLYRKKKQR